MPTLADTVYGTEVIGVIVGGVGPTFRGRGISGVVRNGAGDVTITLERPINLSAAAGEGSIQVTSLTAAVKCVAVTPLTTTTVQVLTGTDGGVATDADLSLNVLRFSP